MTATGYRRRQRKKGYPRQLTPAERWQLDVMRGQGVSRNRLTRMLRGAGVIGGRDGRRDG